MANNGDIRQKIVLEGEKEYSAALKEAQRNLKVLRSELKAETAELGKNASEQQKNEVRTKNLQKQIKEQEKVVKTYEKALEEVRQKYGDNEEAVAKWEVKLNDARTALASMKNGLEDVGKSFNKIDSGAGRSVLELNAMADSFGKISSAASGMSDMIEQAFTGVIGTIKQVVGAVWSDLMEIAAESDNYFDLASFLGADVTEVQKWDSALRATGNDLSSVTSMISRLKYGGKDDKLSEWFDISGENYTNDLEYAGLLLQRMVDMKDEMVANGTWADAMGDIFGAKKVQDVENLLSDWEDIQRGMKEFDVTQGGVGRTEDELQTMADLYVEVGLLQEKWNAFKKSVETKIFGKLALDLTGNFQGALDALIAFMDADTQEERDKALEDFTKNLEEAFTKIGEAIQAAGEALDKAGRELQLSENSYVRLLGQILEGISKAMEWITTEGNLEKVLGFFQAIFDLWLVGKGAAFVSTILEAAAAIKTLTNSKIPVVNNTTDATGDGSKTTVNPGVQQPTKSNQTAAPSDPIAVITEDTVWFGGMANAGAVGQFFSEYEKIRDKAENSSYYEDPETGMRSPFYQDGWTEKTPEKQNVTDQIMSGLFSWAVDMATGTSETQKKVEDTITNFVLDMVQNVLKPSSSGGSSGGGGGGGGGTFMYTYETERSNPLGGRLGASVLNSAWWATQSTPTSDRLNNTLAGLPASIQNGMRNIRVVMDSQVVGELVAPVVSQQIARGTA